MSQEDQLRRQRECLIALSNAWEYYKNREFESSVKNYHKLVDLGCGEENAQDVYLYFGRAYIELGSLDSAIWAFKQGLRYLPEDKNLLENIAYALGRQGNVNEQIYYYERYLEVDPTNVEVFATITDLLRQVERYDDLVLTLQRWLEVEPNNPRVQSDIIAAYEIAGKDPLTFMRQRWEDNPSNAQWGIDYATELVENLDYSLAYRVLEGVIQRTPTARGAYELLADAALDEGDVDRAISALERLFGLDRTDEKPALELTRAYLRKGEFPRALEWAETALKVSTNGGEALYVRAEVYYTAADDCVSGHESGAPNFQDKLVFQMAYEDYRSAVDKGYRRSRTRADFLEKNLIPTKGDWFLQPTGQDQFKPQGNCYSWITRTVWRPGTGPQLAQETRPTPTTSPTTQSPAIIPRRPTQTTDTTPPTIRIDEPVSARGMKKITQNNKDVLVKGRATDESGIYEVLVNGQEVSSLDAQGNFWTEVKLTVGDNRITVQAADMYDNTASTTFTVVREAEVEPPPDLAGGDDLIKGKYYALIIGIDSYSGEWDRLRNAVHDARGVKNALEVQYRFDNFITLYDKEATRANIITKLEWLTDNLNEDDNLLIYYSGHGELDERLNRGFWVPVDAKTRSVAHYVPNSLIQTFLGGIRSQHTLLISDACFSGDIFRGSAESLTPADFSDMDRYYREVYKRPSRQAITSGGIEPVVDRGRDGHSVFTYYFLKALKENQEQYYDAGQLFDRLKIPVANNSDQTPICQAIKDTGDEGGQFIFMRKQ